jgi:hypothetical protein
VFHDRRCSLSICDLAKIFVVRDLGLGAMLQPFQHAAKIFRLLHTLIERFFVEGPGLLARYRHLNRGFEVFQRDLAISEVLGKACQAILLLLSLGMFERDL